MVSLTAMLVMYTLYQSISGSLPQTAYLKMIDAWLLFGLIMPFVVFLVEVIWKLMIQVNLSRVQVDFKEQLTLCALNLRSGPILFYSYLA
jgi:hypothetical protein